MKEVELMPGGSKIEVTEANREQYIDLVIQHRFVKAVAPQMERCEAGYAGVVDGPPDLFPRSG
jgi:hypothetical protein